MVKSSRGFNSGFTLIRLLRQGRRSCKQSLRPGGLKGFTLIELLIVIVIISILAVIGVVTYSGIQNQAKDSKRKADVNALAKAYETNMSAGKYNPVQDGQFTSGQRPKTPEGKDYPCLIGPSSNCNVQATNQFALCVSLGSNGSAACYTPSDSCYCLSSSQSTAVTSGGGGSGGGGGGGGTNPSCDPYGVLTSGLVGYWKMDENNWSGSSYDVKDSSGYVHYGRAYGSANTVANDGLLPAVFNRAANYTGNVNDRVVVPTSTFGLTDNHPFSVSLWVKPASLTTISTMGLLSWENWGTSGFRLGFRSTGHPVFWATQSGGSFIVESSESLQANQWNFLVGVYDGSQAYIYRNGNQIGGPTAGTYKAGVSGNPVSIPLSQVVGGENYSGLIDDARFYNRALSADDVKALYNNDQGCIPQ